MERGVMRLAKELSCFKRKSVLCSLSKHLLSIFTSLWCFVGDIEMNKMYFLPTKSLLS